METSQKNRNRTIIFLIVLAYVVWSSLFILRTSVVAVDGGRYFTLFDDAMVSMRYAWNLSHDRGLVWNPGERVEGYTNLLMTLMMSSVTDLLEKSPAVLAVQIMGMLINLGSAGLVWRLCGSFLKNLPGNLHFMMKTMVLIMVLSYYPFSYWSLMGMETGVLTLILLGALLAMEGYLAGRGAASLVMLGGLLGLAYLARPDAGIYSIPIYAYIFFSTRKDLFRNRSTRLAMAGSLTLFALFPLCQLLFRIAYYQEILPNTYYLKLTGMPLGDRLLNGLGFILPYIAMHAAILGVIMAASRFWRDPGHRFYLSLVVLPILYQVWIGGDAWAYWRIMAPVHPVLSILFVLSVRELLDFAGGTIAGIPGSRLVYYIFAFGIISSNLTFLGEMLFTRKPYQTDTYITLINTAIILDQVTTEDSSVGVYWAGIIPYYSGREAVDFLGKSDPYIARLTPDLSGAVSWSGMYSVPGHNKYDLEYSIKQRFPTYIQYPVWKGQDVSLWALDHYAVVGYKGVQLWLRKDSPQVHWEMLPQ